MVMIQNVTDGLYIIISALPTFSMPTVFTRPENNTRVEIGKVISILMGSYYIKNEIIL